MTWLIVGILVAIAAVGCARSDVAAAEPEPKYPWTLTFQRSPDTGLCYEVFVLARAHRYAAIHAVPVDCALVEKEQHGTVTNGTERDETKDGN